MLKTYKKLETAELLSALEAKFKLMPLVTKNFVKRLIGIKKTNSDVPSDEMTKALIKNVLRL